MARSPGEVEMSQGHLGGTSPDGDVPPPAFTDLDDEEHAPSTEAAPSPIFDVSDAEEDEAPPVSPKKSFRDKLRHLRGTVQIAVNYVISDNRKHKRSLCIGILTVFLVVCFLGLIQNVLARSPTIFLKLSENQVGQYDIVRRSPLLISPPFAHPFPALFF